jgi:hypothetical protein
VDDLGFCQCGCGQVAPLAPYTNRSRGYVKGEPLRYVHGHARRKSGVDFVRRDMGFETECWVWQRSINNGGYGMTFHEGRDMPAHKAFYLRHVGPIPEGLQLDHLCRVRACVNPEHLEVVTNALNCQRGDMAVLDWPRVREIRASSLSRNELAALYGVHRDTIGLIQRHKTWRDDPETPSERGADDRRVATGTGER